MEQIYEQRRKDLKAFVAKLGRGGIARISREAEIDASYLSRCLYPPGKDGKKNIGDEIVTKLNTHFPDWSGADGSGNTIYLNVTKSDREKAIDELSLVVNGLDLAGINKLIGMASVLAEHHRIKQTLSSSA